MRQTLEKTATSAVTGTASIATGVATVMEWLPENIGFIASVLGCILTCVLIVVQIRKACIDGQKQRIEIAMLMLKKEGLERGLSFRRVDNGIGENKDID